MHCSIDESLRHYAAKNAGAHPNAESYDATLFDLQSFLAHQLAELPKGTLLDAGTAYGTLAGFLAHEGWAVSAIDNMADLSQPSWWKQHKIAFRELNLETADIPWREHFDVVLFTEVLEHLNYNPVPVIERLFQATKPGGVVICTTPMKERQGTYHPIDGRYANYAHYRDIPLYWNGYQFEDDHHYFYRLGELMQLFHEVGYDIEEAYPIRKGTTHYLKARRPL